MTTIEQLWETILSRDPELITKSFRELDEIDQHAIIEHLIRMTSGPDWHPEQRRSAQIALDIIANQNT